MYRVISDTGYKKIDELLEKLPLTEKKKLEKLAKQIPSTSFIANIRYLYFFWLKYEEKSTKVKEAEEKLIKFINERVRDYRFHKEDAYRLAPYILSLSKGKKSALDSMMGKFLKSSMMQPGYFKHLFILTTATMIILMLLSSGMIPFIPVVLTIATSTLTLISIGITLLLQIAVSINDSIRGNADTDMFNKSMKAPTLNQFINQNPRHRPSYTEIQDGIQNGSNKGNPVDSRNSNSHQAGEAGHPSPPQEKPVASGNSNSHQAGGAGHQPQHLHEPALSESGSHGGPGGRP